MIQSLRIVIKTNLSSKDPTTEQDRCSLDLENGHLQRSCLETRRKVLKVAKIKDAKYGCKDAGNDDA